MENRCGWCGTDPFYCEYHDTEWGVPEYDSKALWAKLILDGFQAGLSWITILRKREAFYAGFAGLDPDKVALFDEADVERLLNDSGIIRHRGKIEATIGNAKAWQIIEREQGFADYLWGYVDGKPLQNHMETLSDVPAQTALSQAVSKDLKKRGFKFCGPTIVYAFMQATGLINDHLVTCPRYQDVAKLAR